MVVYQHFKLFLIGVFLFGCSIEDLDRQGVQIYNNIGVTSLSQINKAGLLGEGEQPCAYYDTSLTLNGEDVYLVTDKRVIHYEKGRISAMNLSEVKSVRKQSDNIVVTDGKTKMYLNLLVDIDLFKSVLEDKVAESSSSEPVKEAPVAVPAPPEPVPSPAASPEPATGEADSPPPPSEPEPSAEQPPQNNTNTESPSRRQSRPRKR